MIHPVKANQESRPNPAMIAPLESSNILSQEHQSPKKKKKQQQI